MLSAETTTNLIAERRRAPGPPRRVKVLVMDDEEPVRNLLKWILTRNDYEVLLAEDGNAALDQAVDGGPDLIILDLAVPGLNGLAVCQQLRSWLSAPILVLSAQDEETTKIQALDLGADDYLTKPFRAGELLARIRALLRRKAATTLTPPCIRAGDLEIDLARRSVTRAGRPVALTRTEFNILACLAQNADRVVTSSDILLTVWGHDNESDPQTLRVHIAHLRKKLALAPSGPVSIRSVQGVGYCLDTSENGRLPGTGN